RDAFDERRKDQRSRLNLAGGLGLASHALDGLAADAADAKARADHGEAGAERRADEREAGAVGRRLSGDLEKRIQSHLMIPVKKVCLHHPRRPGRYPPTGPCEPSGTPSALAEVQGVTDC